MSEKQELEKFELVFEGPADESIRTMQRLKGTFISDFEFPIEEVQRILTQAPLTIYTSESEESIEHYYQSLKKAGAKVHIVRPKSSSSEATASGEDELVFDLDEEELGITSKERKTKKRIYSLDVDDVLFNTVDTEESHERQEKAVEAVHSAVGDPHQKEESSGASSPQTLSAPSIAPKEVDELTSALLSLEGEDPPAPQYTPTAPAASPLASPPEDPFVAIDKTLENEKKRALDAALTFKEEATGLSNELSLEDALEDIPQSPTESTETPPAPLATFSFELENASEHSPSPTPTPTPLLESKSLPPSNPSAPQPSTEEPAFELSLELTESNPVEEYQPVFKNEEREEEINLAPAAPQNEHTTTPDAPKIAEPTPAGSPQHPPVVSAPTTEKPLPFAETSLSALMQKKKQVEPTEKEAKVSSHPSPPPTNDHTKSSAVPEHIETVASTSKREYLLYFALGLIILFIGNVGYQFFFNQLDESLLTITPEMLLGGSNENTKKPSAAPTLPPAKKYVGEIYPDRRSVVAKGEFRVDGDKVLIQSMAVRVQLPPPPDLTTEQIVEGEKAEPWIVRMDFDYASNTDAPHATPNEISGPVRIAIDDNREKKRITGLLYAKITALPENKVRLDVRIGTTKIDEDTPEILPVERKDSGYLFKVLSSLELIQAESATALYR